MLQKEDTATLFSQNSWIIIVFKSKQENKNLAGPELLKSKLEKYKSISLDFRIYFLYVDFEHPYENDLFEVYRIPTPTNVVSITNLIVNKIAVFKSEKYYFLDTPYIWDRRKNLQGLELKIMSLPSNPFTRYQSDNVSNFGQLRQSSNGL